MHRSTSAPVGTFAFALLALVGCSDANSPSTSDLLPDADIVEDAGTNDAQPTDAAPADTDLPDSETSPDSGDDADIGDTPDGDAPDGADDTGDAAIGDADADDDATDSDAIADTVDPDTVDPDTVDPDTVDPDAVDPDAVDSDVTDPDTQDTDGVDDVADPDTNDADTVDPDVTDPDAHDADDVDPPRNACGGLATLRWAGELAEPDEPCGPCGLGVLACEDAEQLRCDHEDDETGENACGGCEFLAGDPGQACGDCGVWACGDEDSVTCAEPPAGCETPLTCDDLACDVQHRVCTESDGASDAECGACVDDYEEVDGVCRLVDCGVPPAPVNGSVRFESTERGATAQTSCDDGFEAVGAAAGAELVCQADGAWRTDAGDDEVRCEPIPNACGGLSALRWQGELAEPDDACGPCGLGTLTCASEEQLRCEHTDGNTGENACGGCVSLAQVPGEDCGDCGVWLCDGDDGVRCAEPPEGCEAPRTCEDLACATQNRACIESDGESDATCGDCLDDFEEVGGTCRRIDCGAPPALEDGAVDYTATTVGAIARHRCSTGRVLTGLVERTCGADGTWTPGDAACEPVDCGALSAPEGGRIELTGTTWQSTATTRCDAGRSLRGTSPRTCQANGTWSGDPAFCDPIDCGEPPAPDNGSVVFDGTLWGSTAQTDCDTGFSIAGDAAGQDLICLDDGLWMTFDGATDVRCEPVRCGPPPGIANGSVESEGDGYEDVATYACDEGYLLDGEAQRSCLANGAWETPPPACVPRDCGAPASPAGGTIAFTTTTFGSGATITCDAGWESDAADGADEVICAGDGTWRTATTGDPLPDCRRRDCGPLDPPDHGTVEADATVHESVATYACDDAWVLVGDATRTCDGVSRTWSGEAPTCAPVRCPALAPPSNGDVSTTGDTVGATATFSCVDGWTLEGTEVRTCGADAQWTGTPAWCRSDTLAHGCASDDDCSDGEWCPDTTTFGSRRCSPRVDAGDLPMRFLWIPSGSFLMGSPSDEAGRSPFFPENRNTVRQTRPWVMQETPVTRGQWRTLTGGLAPIDRSPMPRDAMQGCGEDCPVNGVSWWSAVWFANALSVAEGLPPCYALPPSEACSGSPALGTLDCPDAIPTEASSATVLDCVGYRLPSEAEWERTVRANDLRATYNGDLIDGDVGCDGSPAILGPIARYCGNSEVDYAGCADRSSSGGPSCAGIAPVAGRLANAWGLHDMLGQVGEWTWDSYTGGAMQGTDSLRNVAGEPQRVVRGGNYAAPAGDNRAASRRPVLASSSPMWMGLRLARTVPNVAVPTCPTLGPPANGAVSLTSVVANGTATFSCDDGYALQGEPTLVCGTLGAWSAPSPTCEPEFCGEPPATDNGEYSATGENVGDVATYTCDYGYELESRPGGPTLTCRTGGSWFNETAGTSEPPSCSALLCDAPAPAIHGAVSAPSREHGATALHTCNDGWVLVGDDVQTCDGELNLWFDEAPICLRDCGTLSAPTNGTVSLPTGTLEGSTATYTCDEGTTLQGDDARTCGADGAWSGAAPVCEPIDCGAPRRPRWGAADYTATTFGSTVNWSCEGGYTLEGATSATCTLAGTWSEPTPRCIAPLGAPCSSDADCPDETWCPELAGPGALPDDHRRCSPMPTLDSGATLRSFWVPPTSTERGSPVGERGRGIDEGLHPVALTRPLFVLEDPLSHHAVETLTGQTPSFHQMLTTCRNTAPFPGLCPAERINRFDAMELANALSTEQGLTPCYEFDEARCSGTPLSGCNPGTATCTTGTRTCAKWNELGLDCDGWRLPTEAEWEHLTRAGSMRATWLGNLLGSGSQITTCALAIAQPALDPIAAWCRVSGGAVRPLGERPSNPWGVRDPLGNVYEWTSDGYDSYPDFGVVDPRGEPRASEGIVRGGGWSSAASATRAAARLSVVPAMRNAALGVRLVRTAPYDPATLCPPLASPANGTVSGTRAATDVATYTCDPGYLLVGNRERGCLSTGVWSWDAPTCELDPRALGEPCDVDAQCPDDAICDPDAASSALRRCVPAPVLDGELVPFAWVPDGTFTMGSPVSEVGRFTVGVSEQQASTTISRGYFLQRTEVTQDQWRALSGGYNPTIGTSGGFPTAPVGNVTWWSALDYANQLSIAEGLTPCYDFSGLTCTGTGRLGTLNCGTGTAPVTPASGELLDCEGYRLPTEAEWERAARAGTTTATWAGNLTDVGCDGSVSLLNPIAWYCHNSLNPTFGTRHTRPVGTRAANPWGFFDLLGNAHEWTADTVASPLPGGTDPLVTGAGNRIMRGGAASSNAELLRAAYRGNAPPSNANSFVGFRLARSVP